MNERKKMDRKAARKEKYLQQQVILCGGADMYLAELRSERARKAARHKKDYRSPYED